MPVTRVADRRRGFGFGFGFAITATTLLMIAASAPSPFYPQFAAQLGLLPVATTLIFAVYAFAEVLRASVTRACRRSK